MKGFYNLASNFQSDICRFLALDKYGGIWLDSDAIILKDLNPVFHEFAASKFEMMLDSEYNKGDLCINQNHHLKTTFRQLANLKNKP